MDIKKRYTYELRKDLEKVFNDFNDFNDCNERYNDFPEELAEAFGWFLSLMGRLDDDENPGECIFNILERLCAYMVNRRDK